MKTKERERLREGGWREKVRVREGDIYIYIYRERERESKGLLPDKVYVVITN